MASLIEELIHTLEEEEAIYQQLIPITKSKTGMIIKDDLLALQEITEKEQEIVDHINVLERKREEVITNIGTVINKNPKELNVRIIIQFLEKQPKEQKQLSEIHDRLKQTVEILMEVNNHNKSLIEQSLEMIEFNMNFIQSTRMSPGSSSYTKGASVSDAAYTETGLFDAKQ